jgi:hypothetical protein
LSYFAGVAGVVAGVSTLWCFFTCGLAAGAVCGAVVAAGAGAVVAGAAGAWAANDSPAAANVRERPITAEVMVFMILMVLFLEASFL